MLRLIPLLLLLQFAYADFSFSLGGSYFIYHSENDEPSALTNPYANAWCSSLEYHRPINKYSMIQLALAYTEVTSNYEHKRVDANGMLLDIQKEGTFTERSYPLVLRYFKTVDRITGYGFGPVISYTEHKFDYDPPTNQAEIDYSIVETIYSTGIGINGLLRFGLPVGDNLFTYADIEFQFIQAISFQGFGQDLSDYSHQTFQVKFSLGLGRC